MGKSTSDEVTHGAAPSGRHEPSRSIAELQSDVRETRLRLTATVDTLDQRVQTFVQQQRAAFAGYRLGGGMVQAAGPVGAMAKTSPGKNNGPLATVIAAWMTVRRLRNLWRSQTSSLPTSGKAWVAGAMIAVAIIHGHFGERGA